MTTEVGPAVAGKRSPFKGPFLGLVFAAGLSTFGDSVWFLALSFTLVDSVGPSVAGAVLALGSLPQLVILLLGGAVADAVGPRRVMMVTDVFRCVVMLAGAGLMVLVGASSAPVLIVMIVVMAIAGAFFGPSSDALRPTLLPDEHLVRGNAVYLMAARGGQAAGGGFGAWLFGFAGIATVAVVNGVSFLLSAFAVSRTRPITAPAEATEPTAPAEPARSRMRPRQVLEDIRAGCRYVLGNRRLSQLVVVLALLELSASGPVNIGLVLLGGRHAGWLLMALTLGSTASFALTITWPPRRRAGLLTLLGLAAQTLCLAGLATGSWVVGAAVFFVLGLVAGLAGVVLISLAQRWSSAAMRGRVMSIMTLFFLAGAPLGNVEIGLLIDRIGLAPTMFAHAAVALLGLLLYCATPALRQADLSTETPES
jgi:MFS family permease